MKTMTILILAGLISGCVTSVKHLSDPRVDRDGYNLVCGGFEKGQQLQVSMDICQNVSPNKGEFILAEVKYRWTKQ